MNYVKKMCILRQIKQGFSGDGKTLSGLVKVEQYGKNLAVEVSVINFAPLRLGEYYCLLSDVHGKIELLPLRGKSLFNILSDMDVAEGFCAVICFIKDDIVPVAYGVNGNATYDWKRIVNATLPPTFAKKSEKSDTGDVALATPIQATAPTPTKPQTDTTAQNGSRYDDETLASENYYKEQEDEQSMLSKAGENAYAKSTAEKQDAETGLNVSENDDAQNVRHPFTTDSQGYYLSVKAEIDALMQKYPTDETLIGAFSCSEWVRVKGEESAPQYLVGVVYSDGKAKYICYALATQDKDAPPPEIKDVCTFVPRSVYEDDVGFFVIFQSAATGECIKPFSI